MSKKPERPAPKAPVKKTETNQSAVLPADAPPIDTSLAANAAAAVIAGKVTNSSAGSAPARKESAAFKQLKAGLNKPAANALGGAFGTLGKGKKSHQPFAGGKQSAHNQTFGDAGRTGVPRRTPG